MQSLARWFDGLARSPFLWGAVATVACYVPIHLGWVTDPNVIRYLAAHWVLYVEMGAFFVGLAALLLRAGDVLAQRRGLARPWLANVPLAGQLAADCHLLLAGLDRHPAGKQRWYVVARLREAIEFVARQHSAESLDEHCQDLAEADADRMQSGYALPRIIIWAIPILGFLGTVIGITIAIANLSPQALEESLGQVTSGLGVAFDTTALALGLSMVLMFVQYYVDRSERQLLDAVSTRVRQELDARFVRSGIGHDPHSASVRRMAESVLAASKHLVEKQVELWQSALAAAETRWSQVLAVGEAQLQQALGAALEQSLRAHAESLAAAQRESLAQVRDSAAIIAAQLATSAEAIAAQQAGLLAQGEVLQRVVAALGEVGRIEDALNRNLAAVHAAGRFEEAMASVAAATGLLAARLGQTTSSPRIELAQSLPRHAA